MNKLHSIAVYALMAPAITLGAGSAFAQAPPPDSDDAQEQSTTQDHSSMPEHAQKEKGMATADRAQQNRMAADRSKNTSATPGTYLSSQPANSFRADELIGNDLKSRPESETIGSISDLLVDENGQIVAVIVEVGGFLALGEKEVAISWDTVERHVNEDGDGYNTSVSVTRDALTNAPEFKKETSKY